MKRYLDWKKVTMSQNNLDSAYGDLCEIIESEMTSRLPKRHIKPVISGNNKRRKVGKPVE